MVTMGAAGAVAGIMAAMAVSGQSGRLSVKQPPFTVTTAPARNVSFMQHQMKLQWGKPYVDANMRVAGNQIFFLDPLRVPNTTGGSGVPDTEPVAEEAPDAPVMDNPPTTSSTSTTTTAPPAQTEPVQAPAGDGFDDEWIFLQSAAKSKAAAKAQLLAHEKRAKKRGGAHEKRRAFASSGTAREGVPVVPAESDAPAAMAQTAVHVSRKTRGHGRAAGKSQSQESFVTMATRAKSLQGAAETARAAAQQAARVRLAARDKAAARAQKHQAGAAKLKARRGTAPVSAIQLPQEEARRTGHSDEGVHSAPAPKPTAEQLKKWQEHLSYELGGEFGEGAEMDNLVGPGAAKSPESLIQTATPGKSKAAIRAAKAKENAARKLSNSGHSAMEKARARSNLAKQVSAEKHSQILAERAARASAVKLHSQAAPAAMMQSHSHAAKIHAHRSASRAFIQGASKLGKMTVTQAKAKALHKAHHAAPALKKRTATVGGSMMQRNIATHAKTAAVHHAKSRKH